MALFALWRIEAASEQCCAEDKCCRDRESEQRHYAYAQTPAAALTATLSPAVIIGVACGIGAFVLLVCVIVGVSISVSNRGNRNRGAAYIDQTRPSGNFQERADFNVAPSPAMVTPTSGTPQFTPAAYPEKDSEISVSMRDNDHMPMPQAKVPYVPYPLGEAGPQPASA